VRRAIVALATVAALSGCAHAQGGKPAAPAPARADTAVPACVAPLDLIRLANPLPRVARKIVSGEPVTIVAIGSSSTSGHGASSPAANLLAQPAQAA